ncbi:uncharacterized protein N7529_011734 [Penicillium soppii]|uniref:uncharacterized protein n=1 Tax=Penicillium soppii TaxID=69789 RepID=UPI002546996B|nr:uncharacterized protein N7529_011734 [Penicillium soppii]KAJ5852349.1 hypothetical protein N7529_011734 [Penicillium soppii]
MAHKYYLIEDRRLEVPPVDIGQLKPFEGEASDKSKHEYSSKYATTVTRPDVAKATSHLAQSLSNPSPDYLHKIN